jgi:hypothetical protein
MAVSANGSRLPSARGSATLAEVAQRARRALHLQKEPGQRAIRSRPEQFGHRVVVTASVAALGLLVTILGSYALDWDWTGFKGDTVWEWLHLLLVPVVLASQPIWLRCLRHERPLRLVLVPVMLGACIFIFLGYRLSWAWTGFPGKELWDWLNLIVLPTTLGVTALFIGGQLPPLKHWRHGAAVAGVIFVVLVVGGYGLGWDWTGFQGNRLSNWLSLLLMPFAVPATFIWLGHRLKQLEEEESKAERELAKDRAELDRERARVPEVAAPSGIEPEAAGLRTTSG